MIEFNGAYYKDKTAPSQSVLVQFDGVLLHIWNISSPFHRVLSSDSFRLPFSPGRHRSWVKLPNGSRVETDDIQALASLKARCRTCLPFTGRLCLHQWPATIVLFSLALVLAAGMLFCRFAA
jgi:hypothetical protein